MEKNMINKNRIYFLIICVINNNLIENEDKIIKNNNNINNNNIKIIIINLIRNNFLNMRLSLKQQHNCNQVWRNRKEIKHQVLRKQAKMNL